ncbi:MAG: hypothetical protein SGPRY_007570 [Prymnesium sp.]
MIAIALFDVWVVSAQGGEDVMSQKAHGTSESPVQENLRWNVDRKNADRICNFNRHYAEYAGCEQTAVTQAHDIPCPRTHNYALKHTIAYSLTHEQSSG